MKISTQDKILIKKIVNPIMQLYFVKDNSAMRRHVITEDEYYNRNIAILLDDLLYQDYKAPSYLYPIIDEAIIQLADKYRFRNRITRIRTVKEMDYEMNKIMRTIVRNN